MIKRLKMKRGNDGRWYASAWLLDWRQKWTPIAISSHATKEEALNWIAREEAVNA